MLQLDLAAVLRGAGPSQRVRTADGTGDLILAGVDIALVLQGHHIPGPGRVGLDVISQTGDPEVQLRRFELLCRQRRAAHGQMDDDGLGLRQIFDHIVALAQLQPDAQRLAVIADGEGLGHRGGVAGLRVLVGIAGPEGQLLLAAGGIRHIALMVQTDGEAVLHPFHPDLGVAALQHGIREGHSIQRLAGQELPVIAQSHLVGGQRLQLGQRIVLLTAGDLQKEVLHRLQRDVQTASGPAKGLAVLFDGVVTQIHCLEGAVQRAPGRQIDLDVAALVLMDLSGLAVDRIGDVVLHIAQQLAGGGDAVGIHQTVFQCIGTGEELSGTGVHHIAAFVDQTDLQIHIRLVINADAGGTALMTDRVTAGRDILIGDDHALQGPVHQRLASAAGTQLAVLHGMLADLGTAGQGHIGDALALDEEDQLAHRHIEIHLVPGDLQSITAEDPVAHDRQLAQHLIGAGSLVEILPGGVRDLRHIHITDAEEHGVEHLTELLHAALDRRFAFIEQAVGQDDQILLVGGAVVLQTGEGHMGRGEGGGAGGGGIDLTDPVRLAGTVDDQGTLHAVPLRAIDPQRDLPHGIDHEPVALVEHGSEDLHGVGGPAPGIEPLPGIAVAVHGAGVVEHDGDVPALGPLGGGLRSGQRSPDHRHDHHQRQKHTHDPFTHAFYLFLSASTAEQDAMGIPNIGYHAVHTLSTKYRHFPTCLWAIRHLVTPPSSHFSDRTLRRGGYHVPCRTMRFQPTADMALFLVVLHRCTSVFLPFSPILHFDENNH